MNEGRGKLRMKKLHVAAIAGGVLLTGLGVAMAATNPDRVTYERFATQALFIYAKEKLCPQAPNIFGLRGQCAGLLQSNQALIQQLIVNGTQRRNFLFFSLYTTELSASSILPPALSSMVPSYRFETVGVFQQFVVYKVQEQR